MFDNKKKIFDEDLKKANVALIRDSPHMHEVVLNGKLDLSAKPVFEIPPFAKKIELPRARIIEMQNYAKMLRKRNPSISQAKLTKKVSEKFHITLTNI